MPDYKKHPYKVAPGIPNLKWQYEVASGQLKKRELKLTGYQDNLKINLSEVTETSRPKGLVAGSFNFGNVTIVTRSDTHVFQNVQNIKSFISAIEGKTPSDQPGQSEGNNSVENINQDSFEDFEIGIPSLPRTMLDIMSYVKDVPGYRVRHPLSDGEEVKNGQKIVRLSPNADFTFIRGMTAFSLGRLFGENTTNIIAPAAGILTYGRKLQKGYKWSEDTGEPIHPEDEALDYTFVAKIRPRKGSSTDGVTYSAYRDIITWFEQAVFEKDKVRNDRRVKPFLDELRKEIDLLKNHKTLIIAPADFGQENNVHKNPQPNGVGWDGMGWDGMS